MKRALDVVVSIAALVLSAPILLLAIGAIRVMEGPPVFFRQRRPGRHGVPFTLVKLRTMRDLYDAAGDPLPAADRLSRFGMLLRATSVDELPQLWNVLKGDMSLVGPRPLLMEYLALYTPEQRRRHEVRPGITGWAQVQGRNAVPWERRFELDVWYVDHRSFWLDLKILLRTVARVLRRDGISQPGHATMERFRGQA